MISIPFSLPDTYGGLAEANGIARFDGKALRLEFIIKDGVFGVVSSGVKETMLDVDVIASIHFKRNVFRGLISIQSHSVAAVSDIPGQKGGEVRMSIKRRHCEDAEEFISAVRLAVSEARLRALQNIQEETAQEEHERLRRGGQDEGS